jgi:uncharacterized protein (DUF1800 family)
MHESLYASRLTFGRRFDDPAPIPAGGAAAWLAAQLSAPASDTAGVNAVLAASTVQYAGRNGAKTLLVTPAAYRMTTTQAQTFWTANNATLDVPSAIWGEIRLVWMVRAVYSTNQLFERMTDFWNDHFIMDMVQDKMVNIRRWFPAHDRIIRNNALGNFGALLLGVAQSPVMLKDLDLGVSSAPHPNENFAREVMELYTLGIAAYLGPTTPAGAAGTGYSDADVTAAAAVLSGWTFDVDGLFGFAAKTHLAKPAAALGQSFTGAGVTAGEQLLAYLAAHPATAQFIASKLYLRFVADAIPAGSTLLPAMAATFAANVDSSNQIAAVLSVMATHPEFLASAGAKLKTPRHLVVSALRASGADFELVYATLGAISQFGLEVYDYPVPAGPPTDAASYIDASAMLMRWAVGAQLLDPAGTITPRPGWPHDADRPDALDHALVDPANGLPDDVPAQVAARLASALLGPDASVASIAAVQAYAASSEGVTAGMLAKPDVKLRAALARVAGAAIAMPEFQIC